MKSIIKRCLDDPEFRAQATRESHILFFLVYLSEHLRYELAPFHKNILKLTEKVFEFLVVAAFRGAGKSTICSVSLPLWLILGKKQKKCILLVTRTQQLARQAIDNIDRAIDGSPRLKRDLWPIAYDGDKTRTFSIEFTKFNAKIIAVSLDQTIRGMKFGSVRPDVIICDDLEDSGAVHTQEGRDALHKRFSQEIIGVGDIDTDIVVLGNTVHEDCLILRLGKQIQSGDRKGHFIKAPIVENGMPTWPGKFKTMDMVEHQRQTVGNELVWRIEFLLDPRLDTESIVKEEWIRTWQTLPEPARGQAHVLGVDLALTIGQYSDYTAIIPALVTWEDEGFALYILPQIVNARLEPLKSKEKVVSMSKALGLSGSRPHIFIEDMGFQRIYVDEWKNEGCLAEGISLRSMSKQERMAIAAQYLQKGVIYFPPHGAELLKRQILGLGNERHDDLADAFTIMILGVRDMSPPSRFGIGELNRMFENERYYQYSPDERKFFFPDHSDDRDGGRSILDMKF